MRIEYDAAADAAYIYLADRGPGGSKHTYPCDPLSIAGDIVLDFDGTGRLIGIEVLAASKKLPPEVLRQAESIG